MRKVYYDVGTLNPQKITGVGVYMLQLYRQLKKSKNLQLQTVLKLSRFKNRGNIDALLESHSQILTPWAQGSKSSIYHGPDFRLNMKRCAHRLVTIHDFVVYNEAFSDPRFTRAGQMDMHQLLSAGDFDGVIVNSYFTASELLKHFPIWKDRVHVTPLGCDRELGPQTQNLKLPEKYILFLGALEKRKNVVGVIQAFEILKKQGFPHQLLLVGPWGFGREEIQNKIQASLFKDDIVCRPYMENSEIHHLFTSAEAFVFPSHYEGFGLPVLEAMSLGTPVVTSNTSALREISGEAALLVDPQDSEALAESIGRLLSSSELRLDLRERGLAHSKKYTWAKCAELTEQAYNKVGEQK